MSLKARRTAANLPHSWELDSWETVAPDVWPHTTARAKWIARAYRKQLVAAGALSRVGRCIVILGAGYARWLENRAAEVTEYKSNNPRITQHAQAALAAKRAASSATTP